MKENLLTLTFLTFSSFTLLIVIFFFVEEKKVERKQRFSFIIDLASNCAINFFDFNMKEKKKNSQ